MKMLKMMSIFLCSCMILIFCFFSFACAVDTTKAEIDFSLKYIDVLPEKGEDSFDDFLEIMNCDSLDVNRLNNIKHQNGKIETININERKVYENIKNKVKQLKKKADDSVPKSGMTEEEIEEEIEKGNISEYYKLPRNWRIADEIYRWVANNIKYDNESIIKDENGQESFRKPQDALFVYEKLMGVCSGKANLINLMMKMAGIPSVIIVSTDNIDGDSHAYNAVYLEDSNNADRTGWTLLDSTNASLTSFEDNFPAFYNDKMKIKSANKNIICDSGHKVSNVIIDQIDSEFSNCLLFTIDEVNYELSGKESDAFIHLNGDDDKKLLEKVKISHCLVNIGMKFEVGEGIKSLVLKGNEIVDLSKAKDLDSIDISKSNKYILEDGVIYEKNIYGAKGNVLFVPKHVKVLGATVLTIDKKNQEKLEKMKEKFLKKFDEYYNALAFNSDGQFLSYQKIQEALNIEDKFKEIYNGIKGNPTDDNLKILEASFNDFMIYSRESMKTIKAQACCMVF